MLESAQHILSSLKPEPPISCMKHVQTMRDMKMSDYVRTCLPRHHGRFVHICIKQNRRDYQIQLWNSVVLSSQDGAHM